MNIFNVAMSAILTISITFWAALFFLGHELRSKKVEINSIVMACTTGDRSFVANGVRIHCGVIEEITLLEAEQRKAERLADECTAFNMGLTETIKPE